MLFRKLGHERGYRKREKNEFPKNTRQFYFCLTKCPHVTLVYCTIYNINYVDKFYKSNTISS